MLDQNSNISLLWITKRDFSVYKTFTCSSLSVLVHLKNLWLQVKLIELIEKFQI